MQKFANFTGGLMYDVCYWLTYIPCRIVCGLIAGMLNGWKGAMDDTPETWMLSK